MAPTREASVTPVSFPNRDGLLLHGMLHLPEELRPGAETALILSPGVKMRVAPHGLYVKLARRFVAGGHPVLRFDFHALGDAEGLAPETRLADFYRATQLGRYVPDTLAAMDWMEREHGASKFIATGLCGGALTGLLAGAADPRIVALFAISIPVILDGADVDAQQHMTPAQLTETRNAYLRKVSLRNWRSWVRLLTFQSDYRMIVRTLVKPIKTRVRRLAPVSAVEQATVPSDNTNPLFASAFERFVAGTRPIFFAFAQADRLLWEFEAKFAERHRTLLERAAGRYHVHVTPNANHIYSAPEWQADLFEQCDRWLSEAVRGDSDAIRA